MVLPGFARQRSAQFAGEFGFKRVRMHVAHRVQQPGHLPLAGAHDAGIGVARRRHAEGRGEIEIFSAGRVPHVDAARALPHNRPRTIRIDERDVTRFVTLQEFKDGAGIHSVIVLVLDPVLGAFFERDRGRRRGRLRER